MRKLSQSIDQIQDHYTAVVVGSGYGGAIAAARIAAAGQDVCVLERGKELLPGEYPDSLLSAAREIQVDTPHRHFGSATGLFDFHVGPDITVLTGCGLGGTSLINANVALEPADEVLADERWPRELRDPAVLKPFMDSARTMLGSAPYPENWPSLHRLEAMRRVAGGLNATMTRPALNVTFTGGPNAAGVRQNACTLCGDCCSGCNEGAKNTVLMNYLPEAYSYGAHIFTEAGVRSVRRYQGRWRVDFEVLDGRGTDPGATLPFVTADAVVLAAGTLGSTQILLRSRDLGLPVSGRLGHGFSGNGDVLAFAYDTDRSVDGVGLGGEVPREDTRVGPAITSLIDLREPGKDRKDALIIEDGAAPGALAAVLPLILAGGSAGVPEDLKRRLKELASVPSGSHHGPVSRTLTYLIMSTDDAGGRIVADGDRVHVEWPGAGQEPAFARDNGILAAATEVLGGTEIPDPLWAWTHERSLITVHPLGGCAMGDDAGTGVVDHKGRVFDPAGGGVHDGLYVCDGSVLPLALDANPLLTISAIAERTARLMIEDRDWTPGSSGRDSAVRRAVPELAPPTVSLAFDERLTGFVSMDVPEGYADGYERGRRAGSSVELRLTIAFDDVHLVLNDPTHPAAISGTVLAPALSAQPLSVASGRFTLFDRDPDQVETWNMRYQMTLEARDGKRFLFEGHKNIREHGALHAWSDTTTLYTTISEAGPEQASRTGTGVLSLKLTDLTRMIRSIRAEGVPRGEQARYRHAFLELFAGEMVHIYGGVLDEDGAFPVAPRKAPPVREPKDPDGTWWCGAGRRWHAGDSLGGDAFLRLTRYRAGDKGPVMLASGFGMSSHSFLTPTIEKNLAEYLAGHGYDIWLFDYRAGIDLPSSGTQFTIDDIAREDWPAAVAKVIEETGRDDVQVLGHCVGSGSLLMALAAGLPGVRAAVCAQFPLHPVTSGFNKVKSAVHTADIFRGLGVRGLSPDNRKSVADELLDVTLRTLPVPAEEHCGQAVCRWINAVYGMTHRHAQLNDATHTALNEMFGIGNIDSLDHLALMMREGLAVTRTGGNDYLERPRLDKNTRLLLLQGAQNYIFHPEGSQQTLAWLRQQNPGGDYRREVLDGYAHLDAIVGKRADVDVFPLVTAFLDE